MRSPSPAEPCTWLGGAISRAALLLCALSLAAALGGCRATALPSPDDPIVTWAPALVDPDTPPPDVLAAYLDSVTSKDATSAWRSLTPLARRPYGSRGRFGRVAVPQLSRLYARWKDPRGFTVKMQRDLGSHVLMAGTLTRQLGKGRLRATPFVFLLSATSTEVAKGARWRISGSIVPGVEIASTGGLPVLAPVERANARPSMYGTAEVRFVARPSRRARLKKVAAWLDDRPVRLELDRSGAPSIVATKQLEALGAGRHRVVAFASQTGGRASATVWQFNIPPVPGRLPRLSYGSEGPSVLELEQRLATLGYDIVPDTFYSGDTEHAVIAFQKLHGFSTDGVAGAEVRRRLARPLVPKARTSHGGSWVEIDLTHQVLLYFVNRRIFRIVDISSGRPGWRTATGSFIFERSITGWRQSRLGLLWNPFYFYGGQAVHGAPSVPPYPASHGCVRVPMSSMERLIPLLEIGMPVEVYGDAP